MNRMKGKYGDKINVLGFPCNQFGHQTNENMDEFLNTLKYVRPGNGFEPAFEVFSKVDVNGRNAHPLFAWMRKSIPIPNDPEGDSKGNGMDDNMALVLPRGAFGDSTVVLWTP